MYQYKFWGAFSQTLETFEPKASEEVSALVNFASSVDDLVNQVVEFTIEDVNTDRLILNNAKNRQIVFSPL